MANLDVDPILNPDFLLLIVFYITVPVLDVHVLIVLIDFHSIIFYKKLNPFFLNDEKRRSAWRDCIYKIKIFDFCSRQGPPLTAFIFVYNGSQYDLVFYWMLPFYVIVQ